MKRARKYDPDEYETWDMEAMFAGKGHAAAREPFMAKAPFQQRLSRRQRPSSNQWQEPQRPTGARTVTPVIDAAARAWYAVSILTLHRGGVPGGHRTRAGADGVGYTS